MKTSVKFKSKQFQPVLPDDRQVRPGRYGGELAFWLCRELAEFGVPTSYPDFDDWGWFLEYGDGNGNEFWLCCGNVEGTTEEWFCFLEPNRRGRFGGKTPSPDRARPLIDALATVLESEHAIGDIEWSDR
jgi:hypothetical protein